MSKMDGLEYKFNLRVTKFYLAFLIFFHGIGIDLLFNMPRSTLLVLTFFFLSAVFPFFLGIYVNISHSKKRVN